MLHTPKKSRTPKRTLVIVSSVLILILAGGTTYALYRATVADQPTSSKTQSIDLNEPTNEQTSDGTTTKTGTVAPEKTPTTNEPENTPTSVAMTLTAKNQNQSTLQLRTQITTIEAGGSCALTLSDGSRSYSQTANVQAQASVSTCQGFDVSVPTTGLTPGLWTIAIVYTGPTTTATVTDSVTVQ